MRVKSASLAAILAAIFAETLPVVLTGVSGLALVGCAVHPTDGSEPTAPERRGSAGESPAASAPAASAPAVSSPADPRAPAGSPGGRGGGEPAGHGGGAVPFRRRCARRLRLQRAGHLCGPERWAQSS